MITFRFKVIVPILFAMCVVACAAQPQQYNSASEIEIPTEDMPNLLTFADNRASESSDMQMTLEQANSLIVSDTSQSETSRRNKQVLRDAEIEGMQRRMDNLEAQQNLNRIRRSDDGWNQ